MAVWTATRILTTMGTSGDTLASTFGGVGGEVDSDVAVRNVEGGGALEGGGARLCEGISLLDAAAITEGGGFGLGAIGGGDTDLFRRPRLDRLDDKVALAFLLML
eukprot:CFRG1408T1